MSQDKVTRTFLVSVDGEQFEIPTHHWLLNKAEQLADMSFMESMSTQKLGGILQGVICTWLQHLGRKVTFDEVGQMSDFNEGFSNVLAFSAALMPDVVPPKNAETVRSKKPSPGESSSDTPTGSSD